MQRPYNFSAGPATIPEEVLTLAAAEMLNWHGSGMGVMEMSHRGPEFTSIYEQAQANLRALLQVPPEFKILFMQGGGLAENAIVPLNLASDKAHRDAANYVVTGAWSTKSEKEARKFCAVHVAATTQQQGFTSAPAASSWQLTKKPHYVYACTNETIDGVEYHHLPDLKALGCDAPLVIDFSSHVASRSIDWSKVGVAFGGAQKNIGPAGLTLVIAREDLIGRAQSVCPSAFDYKLVADNQSMYNTPPTYAIYIAGLTFEWLKKQKEGDLVGLAAIERRNILKAELLYSAIDHSQLYFNSVAHDSRSRMNVPFRLRDEALNDSFLKGAKARGLLQLKGHKSVGGMRASIYNAMPLAGVQALVDYLRDFEKHTA